jgi:hypothetical protein
LEACQCIIKHSCSSEITFSDILELIDKPSQALIKAIQSLSTDLDSSTVAAAVEVDDVCSSGEHYSVVEATDPDFENIEIVPVD